LDPVFGVGANFNLEKRGIKSKKTKRLCTPKKGERGCNKGEE